MVTSEQVGVLVDELTALEQAMRTAPPGDRRPVIIREAWQALAMLDDERARLIDAIRALHVEIAALRTETHRTGDDIGRDGILTAGQLRSAMAADYLPDECRVVVSVDSIDGRWIVPTSAWVQASDAVPVPFGTDPSCEDTIGALIIEAVTRG